MKDIWVRCPTCKIIDSWGKTLEEHVIMIFSYVIRDKRQDVFKCLKCGFIWPIYIATDTRLNKEEKIEQEDQSNLYWTSSQGLWALWDIAGYGFHGDEDKKKRKHLRKRSPNIASWAWDLYELLETQRTNKGLRHKIKLTIWMSVTLLLRKKDKELMNKMLTQISEEEERKTSPFVPKVIQGGKGPSDPSGPEWLGELSTHTTFLANKRNDSGFTLGQFTIAFKTNNNKSVLLYVEGQDKPVWVNPTRFCRDFSHWDTVQTGEEYDLELKANAINRSIQSRDLEDTSTDTTESTIEGDQS